MLDGIPQAAGKFLLGVAGVCVIGHTGSNTVGIVAEALRRAIRQFYEKVTEADSETTDMIKWKLRAFTPYRSVRDWQTLGVYALCNITVCTIALFVAHRFMPSAVTSTNSLLQKIVPFQLTPEFLLTRYAGL